GASMESARDLFEHEVKSMYDGAKQLARGLDQIRKKASHPELSSKIDDLRKASQEQARRLEEVFELMSQKAERSESRSVRGLLEDFSTMIKEEKPEKEPLDVHAAETASDIAEYRMQGYSTMLMLAERSGGSHATPK